MSFAQELKLNVILEKIEKYLATKKITNNESKTIHLSKKEFDFLTSKCKIKKLSQDRALYRNQFVVIRI